MKRIDELLGVLREAKKNVKEYVSETKNFINKFKNGYIKYLDCDERSIEIDLDHVYFGKLDCCFYIIFKIENLEIQQEIRLIDNGNYWKMETPNEVAKYVEYNVRKDNLSNIEAFYAHLYDLTKKKLQDNEFHFKYLLKLSDNKFFDKLDNEKETEI